MQTGTSRHWVTHDITCGNVPFNDLQLLQMIYPVKTKCQICSLISMLTIQLAKKYHRRFIDGHAIANVNNHCRVRFCVAHFIGCIDFCSQIISTKRQLVYIIRNRQLNFNLTCLVSVRLLRQIINNNNQKKISVNRGLSQIRNKLYPLFLGRTLSAVWLQGRKLMRCNYSITLRRLTNDNDISA